jgi:hypothetical protein
LGQDFFSKTIWKVTLNFSELLIKGKVHRYGAYGRSEGVPTFPTEFISWKVFRVTLGTEA